MTDYRKLLTLSIEDAGGEISPVSVYIGDSGTGGAEDEESFLDTYLVPLWDAIKPLINGVLVKAQVTVEYPLSAFSNNTPTAISDVEEKAFFTLLPCDKSLRAVRLSLPTVKESIFTNLGAGKNVDFTNSDVQIFEALLTHDLDENGIDMVDSHGNEICQMLEGIALWKG